MTVAASVHEARRREVAAVTARLLAQAGMERVTLRDVAAATGYSTHIVSHYFDSKQELLLLTLRESSARSVERLKAAIRAGSSIQDCLETLLPLDEERRIDAIVWFAFWASATHDAAIAAEQQRFGLRWRRLLSLLLRIKGHAEGDAALTALRLQTAVAGIGVHGALNVWSPATQRRLLAAEIDSALATASTAHGMPVLVTDPAGATALETENRRLRQMLLDAMIEAAALREEVDALRQAANIATPTAET